MNITTYAFDNGHTASSIRVETESDLYSLPKYFGVVRSRPVLVLVGGASKMEPEAFTRLQRFFNEVLAPIAETLNVTAIDGGTDCGVMQLMGQARTQIGGTFPLIGVCAIGTIALPDGTPPISQDAAPLEPNHTHFVFVPGNDWGAESPWLAKLATSLAGNAPSCTLVSNGGEITWKDVGCSVDAERPTVVIQGSGRTADAIAQAVRGEASDDRAQPLIQSGYIELLDLDADLDALAEQIRSLLTPSVVAVSGT